MGCVSCVSPQHALGSVASVTAGSHMRTDPLELTTTRRQRIGPAAVWQAPPPGLLKSIVKGLLPTRLLAEPRPLNVTLVADAASIAFGEPSWLLRFCTMNGSTVSDGSTPQLALGSARLTIQCGPAAARVQPASSVSTRLKRTTRLRRSASARAS